MVHTLRPLSLGKLLDETFDIYRRNFVLFTGISAVPNTAFLLVLLPWAGWKVRDLESMGEWRDSCEQTPYRPMLVGTERSK